MKLARNELLYRESYIVIEYNYVEDWLYVNWRGYVNYDTVTAGCEKILHYMVARNCYKILNDNTNVEGIWSGASKWVGTDWMPRMRLAGLQCFAWIQSPSTLSQMSTNKALKYTEETDLVNLFEDKEQAMLWLQTC